MGRAGSHPTRHNSVRPKSEPHIAPPCTLTRAPRAERGCHPPPTVDQQSTHKATARDSPAHGVCTKAVAPQHAGGTGVSCAAYRVAGDHCPGMKSGLPASGRAHPPPCATEDAHHHPGEPTRSRQTAGRSEGAPNEAVCIILKGILSLGTFARALIVQWVQLEVAFVLASKTLSVEKALYKRERLPMRNR